jgi:DNA-binding beta-propeller fold protein YncE
MFAKRARKNGISWAQTARLASACALLGMLGSCATGPAPGPWLYVADFDTASVTAYTTLGNGGDLSPFKTYRGANTQLAGPVAVAIDSNRTLYVVNQSVPSVTEYALADGGNIPPTAIISGRATGLAGPRGIAVDPTTGNIFVANFTSNSVTVYAPSGPQDRAPLYTVTAGVSQPVGVVVIGEFLWILNSPGAGGPTLTGYRSQNNSFNGLQPMAVVSSPAIQNPQGLAADCCGWLYVTNFDANSVAVFLSFVSGTFTTTPWAVIQGGATGLQGPESVAFNSKGDMFVANRRGSSSLGSITIYPGFSPPGHGPNSSPTPQNLAPDTTLQGPDTQLSHIIGITIG